MDDVYACMGRVVKRQAAAGRQAADVGQSAAVPDRAESASAQHCACRPPTSYARAAARVGV
jgi:hypothetical protein